MADTKIEDLTEDTSPASDDSFVTYDKSAGVNKRVEQSNLVVNVVKDTTPQLGGNLDFNGKVFTGTAQSEITDELTSITHTAPGTPDYAIQDFGTAGGLWAFADKDEANTVLSVILNNQTRINELEARLTALGLIPDAD